MMVKQQLDDAVRYLLPLAPTVQIRKDHTPVWVPFLVALGLTVIVGCTLVLLLVVSGAA